MKRSTFLRATLSALALSAGITPAMADEYPSRAIELVVHLQSEAALMP